MSIFEYDYAMSSVYNLISTELKKIEIAYQTPSVLHTEKLRGHVSGLVITISTCILFFLLLTETNNIEYISLTRMGKFLRIFLGAGFFYSFFFLFLSLFSICKVIIDIRSPNYINCVKSIEKEIIAILRGYPLDVLRMLIDEIDLSITSHKDAYDRNWSTFLDALMLTGIVSFFSNDNKLFIIRMTLFMFFLKLTINELSYKHLPYFKNNKILKRLRIRKYIQEAIYLRHLEKRKS